MIQQLIYKLSKIPLGLLTSIILVNFIGLITLYFSTNNNFQPFVYKQLLSLIFFLFLSLLIASVDLKLIYKYSYHIYALLLFLLLMIEIIGHTAMGATRWFGVGGIKMQPSEFMKIGLILFLARYYHNISLNNLSKLSAIFIPIIFTLIPALIILKQPDLGTAMIIILTASIIIFASGTKIKNLIYLILPGLISIPLAWNLLHNYQKKRLLMFLNPESDPLGSGYNIIQSKISIGSGGLFGKGLGNGTQSNLDFLPEHQTDFIFSCFAEETGFLGCIVLLIIYFTIILQSIYISFNARSIYGKILVIGVVGMFFLHILINVAMVSGIFPVTGKPLPFMSYGRNVLGSMLISFGLVMNVYVHKKENFVKS